MRRNMFIFGAILLLSLTGIVEPALAHGGGLDGQGCHHNRKVGGYHCHRGPLAGQSFQSKEEAMRALETLETQSQSKPKQ